MINKIEKKEAKTSGFRDNSKKWRYKCFTKTSHAKHKKKLFESLLQTALACRESLFSPLSMKSYFFHWKRETTCTKYTKPYFKFKFPVKKI